MFTSGNNSYQETIKMAPFEALYDRKCRTPLNWSEPGERWFFGLDLVDGEKGDESIPVADTLASREKPRGADLELSPDLGRAPDRMVVTEGVPINLTL